VPAGDEETLQGRPGGVNGQLPTQPKAAKNAVVMLQELMADISAVRDQSAATNIPRVQSSTTSVHAPTWVAVVHKPEVFNHGGGCSLHTDGDLIFQAKSMHVVTVY
jgi:hypothetical protein